MKYSTGLIALLSSSSSEPLVNRHVRQVGIDPARRYEQLTDMMKNYNPHFDTKKYWTYECNCGIVGDQITMENYHGKLPW